MIETDEPHDNHEITPINDEWSFWYAIRGKEAKDAEHYNGK